METERLVREPAREEITSVPKVTWWDLERKGLAPKRIHISRRCVAWKLSDLQAWIETVADGREWGDSVA